MRLHLCHDLTLTRPGFNPQLPSIWHRGSAKLLGAGMWFFIFWRARWVVQSRLYIALLMFLGDRQDGPVLLVRSLRRGDGLDGKADDDDRDGDTLGRDITGPRMTRSIIEG